MKHSWSLMAKLVSTGVAFLCLAMLSIGLTLWVSWHLEGGAAAVNEAGRLRMLTYRLALSLQQPDSAESQRIASAFAASLTLLREGDPARPLMVPTTGESRERQQAVEARWQALHAQWMRGEGAERAQRLAQADGFVHEVDAFVASIESELARWTTVLHMFQLTLMALAIGSAVAMLYTGYLLVLNPLARLKRGLAALRDGQMSTRVEVDSNDEFGELSAGFNAMADNLQSLYETLEERVREKTARLEVKRQRLADLYDVSAFLARSTQLDQMAQGFAQKLRRIAKADAVAVRWSDEHNARYVLLASDNLPAEIRDDESCLDTGSCHCGQPREAAGTRVIPIIPSTPAPLTHCREAGFRTVVPVPVQLHERLLGEVDLFYTGDASLTPEDRDLLDTLASHLAGAMEGLRVAALEREAAVGQERSLLARELHDSIAQSLAFLKIQVQLLRGAVERQDSAAADLVLGELDTGVRESYADVRELLMHFRTRTSDESIEPALRTTLSKFEHQTGMPAHLHVDARGIALAPDVQVQVLHIVQEALSNIRKHARASQVWVEAVSSPAWRFEVRDDGVGFDPHGAAPDETHVGMRIMQERAQRIGATVRVDAQPGRGCSVVLELPAVSAAERPAAALAQAA